MAKERHSHPDDYTGSRTKGRRMGSLWYSETSAEGDVTFLAAFDEYSTLARIDMLTDWIGMLKRELTVQQAVMEKDFIKFLNLPEANQ